MSFLKPYLKILSSIGYPNQSENLARMSKVVNYTPHQFQEDLLNTLGVIGTTDFVGKTFSKMGAMSSPGYKVELEDVGEEGSYVHLIIDSYEVIPTNEVGNFPFEVWINYSWGENQIIHDGVPMTIDEIYDEIGLGEVADYDELIDGIMDDVIYKVYIQTGFQLHFDGQI
jgi:hypothetical protein